MSELIGSSGQTLSNSGTAILRALAGAIIPASAEHGVPGADDEAIFTDLVASAGPALRFVGEALGLLEELAGDDGFLGADTQRRVDLAEGFRQAHPDAAALIVSLICQSYYRDPRVLESLGTPRPSAVPGGL